jgi:hypothetical protein
MDEKPDFPLGWVQLRLPEEEAKNRRAARIVEALRFDPPVNCLPDETLAQALARQPEIRVTR